MTPRPRLIRLLLALTAVAAVVVIIVGVVLAQRGSAEQAPTTVLHPVTQADGQALLCSDAGSCTLDERTYAVTRPPAVGALP